MQCYRPLRAYMCTSGAVVFTELRRHDVARQISLPCGQCTGCRLERSRHWAIRCVHEKTMHIYNQYITLTYDNEHLPENGNLCHRDFQLFIKRVRKTGAKIRYYMCGEYGGELGRPHYHAIIFNWQLPDKILWKTVRGNKLYTSATLTKLWGNGHALTGEVTFESAAYVARYIMKKQTGKTAPLHYEQINKETGEITIKTSEYNKMSLKPGIGREWIEKYFKDVYGKGTVITRGVETTAPTYYDNIAKKLEPSRFEEIAWQREQAARARAADNTDERLAVRETVAKARIRHLKRDLT